MLKEHLEGLTDDRQPWKVKHDLLEIVVMTICAVIAGCDVWEDIFDYCRVKENWFRESLNMKLEHGIPSHDTFQRVWGMIHPEEFERRFRAWIGAVCQKTEGEIVSIDGKTVRGSGGSGKTPLHMVSAWANAQRMVLGQVATAEKSNEITAVPNLLEMLDIAGCIVTADAMSCQKEIAKTIIKKEAEYVLALKENQPLLYQETKEYFQAAMNEPQNYPAVEKTRTLDKGHGRIERRDYYFSKGMDWYANREKWTGLAGIGMVHSRVEKSGQTSEDFRYYITSLTDVQTFSKAVRKHWGIENSLHWCLDMAFREDYSRIRKDHSAENMAVVRHIALNVLQSFPAKISLARKRRRCSYDDDFFADVMRSVHA